MKVKYDRFGCGFILQIGKTLLDSHGMSIC